MKKFIKLLDVLLAVGGAISLGILMEFVISSIDDDGLGFLAATAISIVGAGLLIACVIIIWVAASGELKESKSKQGGSHETSETSEAHEPSESSDDSDDSGKTDEAVIAESEAHSSEDATEIK